MDLGLGEEQKILRTSARDFLERECPKSLVREMEEDERGYTPELWRKMADVGWLGLIFPEQYGGSGGNFLDLTVLVEEMGRACLPGPFFPTVILCGLPILAVGTEEQKRELLPKIARGEKILTMALTEAAATFEAQTIKTRAISDKDEYVINGMKLFVPDAHIADNLLCVARTKEGLTPQDGISILLTNGTNSGVKCTLLKTMAADKQCEVLFDNARVSKKDILGEVDQAWPVVERVLQQATVAKCVELLGNMQQVLEMAVAYAKERVQFDRPIGSFQVIQHYCANMAINVDASRLITYKAAWKIEEGIAATRETSMAKAWVSDASYQVTAVGHEIFGGIGFTKDHDMQLYFRRAAAGQLNFGEADFHRRIVAHQIGVGH